MARFVTRVCKDS